MIHIRQSVYNPYYAPPLNHPLWERNVKQEICNSYHLGATFDPVVSHWPEYPLQSGIRRPRVRVSPVGGYLSCVCVGDNGRAPGGEEGGEGRQERSSSTGGNFDRGSVQKEVAVYTRRIGMLRT